MRISDWSSDVCSSDLPVQARRRDRKGPAERGPGEPEAATVPSDRERETTKMQTGSASRRAVVGLIAGIAGIAAIATVGGATVAHAETTLEKATAAGFIRVGFANEAPYGYATPDGKLTGESPEADRKSTRLNSSHYCSS